MTIYAPDALSEFGNALTAELPPNDAAPGTANDATAKAPLGTLFRYKGNIFRYVKFDSGTDVVASAKYGVAHWLLAGLDPTNGLFTVTSDYSSGLAGINSVAGIFGAVLTTGNYTWIQVGGVATVTSNVSTAIGDSMIGSSVDLTLGRIAADSSVTAVAFGVALTAYAAGTASVLLSAHRLVTL